MVLNISVELNTQGHATIHFCQLLTLNSHLYQQMFAALSERRQVARPVAGYAFPPNPEIVEIKQ